MKEIEISSTTFNMVVNTLKNFRITDDSRPNVSADDKILNFVYRWKKERLNKLKVE